MGGHEESYAVVTTGTPLAIVAHVAGMLWVTDREPGIRTLFGEVLPGSEVLDPAELEARLALGQRPDALVIDGTQFLSLPARQRNALLNLPRLLVCTGVPLGSLPMNLVSGPGVVVLAKPFCVEDLEAAVEWLGGEPASLPEEAAALHTLVQQRRNRRPRVPTP